MRNKNKRRDVYIYTDWTQVQGPHLVGVLHSELLRGKEIFSFEYHDKWLKSGYAHSGSIRSCKRVAKTSEIHWYLK